MLLWSAYKNKHSNQSSTKSYYWDQHTNVLSFISGGLSFLVNGIIKGIPFNVNCNNKYTNFLERVGAPRTPIPFWGKGDKGVFKEFKDMWIKIKGDIHIP